MGKEILICTATIPEEKACRSGIKTSCSEDKFQVLCIGVGESAGDTLASYLNKNKKPTLIVSTGTAGAITSPSPELNSWIVAQRIFSEKEEVNGVNLKQNLTDITNCTVISLPRIFKQGESTPNILNSLNEPLAVDMESASLATISNQHQIPFLVLRMITDTPQEPLPELFYPLYALLTSPHRRKLQSLLLSLNEVRKDMPGFIKVTQKLGIWYKLIKEGWTKYASEMVEMDLNPKD